MQWSLLKSWKVCWKIGYRIHSLTMKFHEKFLDIDFPLVYNVEIVRMQLFI